MNLGKLSEELGYSAAYFYSMKKANPDKYNAIFKDETNEYEALAKYVNYVEQLVLKMEKILSSYKKKRDFGEIVHQLGLSNITDAKNFTQTHVAEEFVVYKIREENDFVRVRYSTVLKWEKIVEYHELREVAECHFLH